MNHVDVDKLDPKDFIIIKGARVHNLKNVSLAIPRNKFVVITGLSGSGKSSLAFDTLYADGQRRYVESLSSYARQFLGRMSKPNVDYIKGISPAIAIEQKVNTRNPRSTVGTSTEIYEYLKLLFARIGKTYSPVSGNLVKRDSISNIVDYVTRLPDKSKLIISCPLIIKLKRKVEDQLNILLQQGFTRIMCDQEILKIEDLLNKKTKIAKTSSIYILIDRLVINKDENQISSRIADSAQTAFFEGNGTCIIDSWINDKHKRKVFSNKFEMDGITFEEPSVNLFSFNNPYGACKSCEGFGSVIGIDEELVIPNKGISIYDDAIACWRGEKMGEWKEQLVMNAYKFDFPIHKPFYELTEKERLLLWEGNQYFSGLNDFFKYVEEQTYKIQYRVMLSRYRGKTVCPECKGSRLRKDATYVKINNHSISDIVLMSVKDALNFFNNLNLDEHDSKVASRVLKEITSRLQYLDDVGLSYISMNRLSNTLSGGESQRINLATSIGSSLVGSMYILDEPSIGLHPRDTHRLIHVIKQLRDLGNTLIVVEHDEEIIKAADEIIDIGPLAGRHGGEIVFQGSYNEILHDGENLTGKYLMKKLAIPLPETRKKWNDYIEVSGARENNLKGFNVKFPLNTLTVVTGVSGSGKTSLVKNILFRGLKRLHGGYGEKSGKHDQISGDINRIDNIELVDQNPIGRSSRSNPATYVKAFDDIRTLFSNQQTAKIRGYKPGFFSFNIPGGRCEVCEGEGYVKIEMQFMADISLLCESCNGKRFKDEVLDITFKEKNITEILDMTINEAIEFFSALKKPNTLINRINSKLLPLQDVGLGYLRLGQPSSTLSGGEAQRIKLAFFLSKGVTDKPTLFIFDEPTTGLHFHDINKLLAAFDALINKGHSIIVIEHNIEVVKTADWIIDLGPEGGDEGGHLVFEGIPEELVKSEKSYTAAFLGEKLGYLENNL
ncbi:excinuclease ABC subunit UvrA [candidate division KSB1 bacterium]